MNKITVIILTKAQEAIAEILELPVTEVPAAPVTEMTTDAELPPALAPYVPEMTTDAELPPALAPYNPVALDSEGLPWDKRIHSTGKTFMAKGGTWKLLRGVDSLLVARVKTELKRATLPPAPPVPEVQSDCAIQGLNASRAETEAATADTGLTWALLLEKIAGACTDPKGVLAACQKFNVHDIGALQDTPVLVPLVAKELGF